MDKGQDFKKTFIHELGHYFANKFFKYEIEAFHLKYQSNSTRDYYNGYVTRIDKTTPKNAEERAKHIIISWYGCAFESIYTGNCIKNCFNPNNVGFSDFNLIKEDLLYNINPNHRYQKIKDFETISDVFFNRLKSTKLQNILKEISIENFWKARENRKEKKERNNQNTDEKTAKELQQLFLVKLNNYNNDNEQKMVSCESIYEIPNIFNPSELDLEQVFDFNKYEKMLKIEIECMRNQLVNLLNN